MGRKNKEQIEEEIFDAKIQKLREELMQEEKRLARLDIQERALLGIVRSGQARRHTVRVEVLPDRAGNKRYKNFTFYKVVQIEKDKQREKIPVEELRTGYQ